LLVCMHPCIRPCVRFDQSCEFILHLAARTSFCSNCTSMGKFALDAHNFVVELETISSCSGCEASELQFMFWTHQTRPCMLTMCSCCLHFVWSGFWSELILFLHIKSCPDFVLLQQSRAKPYPSNSAPSMYNISYWSTKSSCFSLSFRKRVFSDFDFRTMSVYCSICRAYVFDQRVTTILRQSQSDICNGMFDCLCYELIHVDSPLTWWFTDQVLLGTKASSIWSAVCQISLLYFNFVWFHIHPFFFSFESYW
jgi:hypothetical protein